MDRVNNDFLNIKQTSDCSKKMYVKKGKEYKCPFKILIDPLIELVPESTFQESPPFQSSVFSFRETVKSDTSHIRFVYMLGLYALFAIRPINKFASIYSNE